jgi:membrane-bound lytic murein transglycosylase A
VTHTPFPARRFVLSLLPILLASCAPGPTPTASGPAPVAETAFAAGVRAGPAFASLGVGAESASRALAAFRTSCPTLIQRADGSGLTRPADWTDACTAAETWPAGDTSAFFDRHFEVVQVGDGRAFATGYFEPRIAGSRTRSSGYAVPVYRLPDDLIDADLGLFSDQLKGRRLRGRIVDRKLLPYYDRAEIEDGALAGRGLELAWAADPIELFFLEIQGSGQLLLPNGDVMRIGYAGQNGRDYVAIGKLLKDRKLIEGAVSMQAVVAWLRAHPEEGRALMRENRSYIFFDEIRGEGPIGALGRPLTPRGSVAADPKFVPLGAPVLLATDRPETTGVWIAQDTGGAIKGANRFDTFWGAGDEAAAIAGTMAAHGTAYLLLPKGTLERLNRDAQAGG